MRSSIFKLTLCFLLSSVMVIGLVNDSWAKKNRNKKESESAQTSPTSNSADLQKLTAVKARIDSLSTDDKFLFDSLSDEQKKSISEGKAEPGFNEWMVKLALGAPYYATEHHPIFVDYEQVWLYIKPQINKDVKEENIIDSTNNWPSIHRTITTKSCMIGDFFVLFDRGVVTDIVSETEHKIYGSCTVTTSEAFLPIVNGKPVEPK